MTTVQTRNNWQVAPVAEPNQRTKSNGNGHYVETLPGFVLDFRPVIDMTDDQFFVFCQVNRDLRIERNSNGVILIMPPTGWETGKRNAFITTELTLWARSDKTGDATDSSGGYKLPNGATRAPDAAWIRKIRLAAIPKEQRQKFLPLCPDFVIELRSPSDGLKALQDKMEEYCENGVQLGWLIDPTDRSIYLYRPNMAVEHLQDLAQMSGDPLLPGFVLDLNAIWEVESL